MRRIAQKKQWETVFRGEGGVVAEVLPLLIPHQRFEQP